MRFPSPQGLLHVEDVWDLPLLPRNSRSQKANLDDMAKAMHKELRDSDTESFVLKKSDPDEELQLRFDIVKHIIDVRLKEKEIRENEARMKEKKAQILGILADKEIEDLKGKSADDLKKLLAEL